MQLADHMKHKTELNNYRREQGHDASKKAKSFHQLWDEYRNVAQTTSPIIYKSNPLHFTQNLKVVTHKDATHPSDSSESNSDDDRKSSKNPKYIPAANFGKETSTRFLTTYNEDEDSNKVIGTNGRNLVNSNISQPTYTGKYEEDLQEVIEILDDMA